MKYTLLVSSLLLAGCSFGAVQRPLPTTDYPDATTPAGLTEFNSGIIADVVVYGHSCNIVADDVAKAVEKWQCNRTGFYRVLYHGHALTAIDKGVIWNFDHS